MSPEAAYAQLPAQIAADSIALLEGPPDDALDLVAARPRGRPARRGGPLAGAPWPPHAGAADARLQPGVRDAQG